MRRKMFFPIFTVLYCLLIYGCSSDNDSGGSFSGLPTVILYAHCNAGDSLSSRATEDQYGNILWSTSDVVNVNGVNSTGITITGQVAQFTVAAGSPYYAICPAYSDVTYNSTAHTFALTFPSSQPYNNNTSFSDGVYPLVSVSSTQNMYFHHVCGVMIAQIRAQLSGVSKIRFLSADKAVAGAATVDPSAQTLTVSGTTMYMDVAFSTPQSLQYSSPVTIHMVLPTGTYGAGWALQLLDASGNVIIQKTVSTAITISCGQWTNAGKFYYTSGSDEAYGNNGNHEGMTYAPDYTGGLEGYQTHEGMTNSGSTVTLPDWQNTSSTHEGMTTGNSATISRVATPTLSNSKGKKVNSITK
jgi:hypothetical protein